MKHGLWLRNGAARDMRATVSVAISAERAGWDGVFVSDSILEGWSDPWTVLAAIAERTQQLTLGTWVVPVPLHQPWRLAHTLAALDQLSGGRLLVGTGLGLPDEYETFGIEQDMKALGRRYDEALDVITRLWQGVPVDHEGEFYRLRGAVLPITPIQQPRIPIVPGGWWPNRAPFRRAARWDGVMPFWPALLGGRPGPAGQAPSTASIEDELRDLIAFARSLTDDLGEIVLPLGTMDGRYNDLCEDVGATWMLHTASLGDDDIARGPAA